MPEDRYSRGTFGCGPIGSVVRLTRAGCKAVRFGWIAGYRDNEIIFFWFPVPEKFLGEPRPVKKDSGFRRAIQPIRLQSRWLTVSMTPQRSQDWAIEHVGPMPEAWRGGKKRERFVDGWPARLRELYKSNGIDPNDWNAVEGGEHEYVIKGAR